MACGLPTVITDVGAVRDYVDETCALLCPPGSVDAMVEAATQLLSDATLRERLGTAARKRAESFAWEKVGERLLSIYRSEFDIELSSNPKVG